MWLIKWEFNSLVKSLFSNQPLADHRAKTQIKANNKQAEGCSIPHTHQLLAAGEEWKQFVCNGTGQKVEEKSIPDCGQINTRQVCVQPMKARNPERLVLIKAKWNSCDSRKF